jgi:hypothetical protein
LDRSLPTNKMKYGKSLKEIKKERSNVMVDKIQYCVSKNEDLRGNLFRNSSRNSYIENLKKIGSYSHPQRRFRRLPHLPSGVELSRQNFEEVSYRIWYRRRSVWIIQPHEIVVASNRKLYFQTRSNEL